MVEGARTEPDSCSGAVQFVYTCGACHWRGIEAFYRTRNTAHYTVPQIRLRLTNVSATSAYCSQAPGQRGMMANVARIFNDAQGAEICERTGKNPQYTYLSLGCSKAQEQRMLNFARAQVGKPFSNMGMARSLFFPRTTTLSSFYCAELVAAILKQGGLMYVSMHSNSPPFSLALVY